MKKTIRLLSFIIMIAVCVFVFSGCQGDDGKINIGIIQYGSHSSLDNCYNGLRAALDESDIADQLEIDYQNGNMESSTCDTIAKNMAAKGYDMIIAIKRDGGAFEWLTLKFLKPFSRATARKK